MARTEIRADVEGSLRCPFYARRTDGPTSADFKLSACGRGEADRRAGRYRLPAMDVYDGDIAAQYAAPLRRVYSMHLLIYWRWLPSGGGL